MGGAGQAERYSVAKRIHPRHLKGQARLGGPATERFRPASHTEGSSGGGHPGVREPRVAAVRDRAMLNGAPVLVPAEGGQLLAVR
jgi:hypothetical protein